MAGVAKNNLVVEYNTTVENAVMIFYTKSEKEENEFDRVTEAKAYII